MNAPFKPAISSNVDTTYFPIEDIDQTDHSAEWEHQIQLMSEGDAADLAIPFIGYTFKSWE